MILGIAGSLGGGKGTVVEYLKERKGFHHYSSSDRLRELIEERGEVVDRNAMNDMANELRAADPAGVPAETFKQYERDGQPGNTIFEALHSVPEAEFVRSKGGVILAVTAEPDIRYERIRARSSIKDDVTKDEFVAQQKREEQGSADPNKSNIFDVIAMADYTIENNGTRDDLHQQIETFLNWCNEAGQL